MADVEDNAGPTPLPPHDDTGPLEEDDSSIVVRTLFFLKKGYEGRIYGELSCTVTYLINWSGLGLIWNVC